MYGIRYAPVLGVFHFVISRGAVSVAISLLVNYTRSHIAGSKDSISPGIKGLGRMNPQLVVNRVNRELTTFSGLAVHK
jgi:hypothetical protein